LCRGCNKVDRDEIIRGRVPSFQVGLQLRFAMVGALVEMVT